MQTVLFPLIDLPITGMLSNQPAGKSMAEDVTGMSRNQLIYGTPKTYVYIYVYIHIYIYVMYVCMYVCMVWYGMVWYGMVW